MVSTMVCQRHLAALRMRHRFQTAAATVVEQREVPPAGGGKGPAPPVGRASHTAWPRLPGRTAGSRGTARPAPAATESRTPARNPPGDRESRRRSTCPGRCSASARPPPAARPAKVSPRRRFRHDRAWIPVAQKRRVWIHPDIVPVKLAWKNITETPGSRRRYNRRKSTQ